MVDDNVADMDNSDGKKTDIDDSRPVQIGATEETLVLYMGVVSDSWYQGEVSP